MYDIWDDEACVVRGSGFPLCVEILRIINHPEDRLLSRFIHAVSILDKIMHLFELHLPTERTSLILWWLLEFQLVWCARIRISDIFQGTCVNADPTRLQLR